MNDPAHVPDGSVIHLFGHSAGGAGVRGYLLGEAVWRKNYGCPSSDSNCGKRIVSATTIDSPLGGPGGEWQKAFFLGFSGGLPIYGPTWQAWAGRGCFIYNVFSAPNEVISGPMPQCEREPLCQFHRVEGSEYLSPGRDLTISEWHSWTFNHAARSVREHLLDVWQR